MAITTASQLGSESAGIGLRLPHIAEVVATRPQTGWLEVHPENFLSNPHAAEFLQDLSTSYPISLHTVGISIGSVGGIDKHHLSRIRDLMGRVQPVRVSGHLAWSTYGAEYLNDLLPLPYNEESLDLTAKHVREVQDYLGRPFLVENPSSYMGFTDSTMREADFLNELVDRTDCQLLCDVSNIHVSAHNMGFDAREYIDRLRDDAIGEIHLGGYTREPDEAFPGRELLVDTHAARISKSSWELYGYAIRKFGSKPTLIEWDNDIPSLRTLLTEAATADQITDGAATADQITDGAATADQITDGAATADQLANGISENSHAIAR